MILLQFEAVGIPVVLKDCLDGDSDAIGWELDDWGDGALDVIEYV